MLLDSGASVSVTNKYWVSQLSTKRSLLVGPDGKEIRHRGVSDVTLQINGEKREVRVFVLDDMSSEYDIILGTGGLKEFKICLDFNEGKVEFKTQRVPESCASVINLEESSKMSKLKSGDFQVGNLTSDQRKQLDSLLEEYQDLFLPVIPGSAKGVQHEIEIEKGIKPIFQRPYSIPFSRKKVAKEEVEKMLKSGVVRSSKSPWSSPIVLVVKKDGGTRFCVDYTKLNKVTKRDQYPLPNIDQILRQVKGKKYFSSLDLTSGYWQIKMNEEDIEKTAFTIDEGHFEFVVLPFGLTNAPATFQRYMNQLLRDIKESKCYIDDILVFTDSWEEHITALRAVFEIMRKSNLRFKSSKCHFGMSSMKWVGHVIDQDGIRVDPEKTFAIREYPNPRNEKELRRFLGMSNYYRKFIKNYATIAAPLYYLTRKGVNWKWEELEKEAFESLKKVLTSTDVLANPDFERPYLLHTDASELGMGAVLSQVQNGEEKPIAFASQHFTVREKKYSTIEKEAAAIVWAMNKFHVYLYGAKFRILSDHQPLKWLYQRRDAVGRLGRWQCRLMEYDGLEEVEHIKGKDNEVADTLSRTPEILAVEEISHETLKLEQEKDENFEGLQKDLLLEGGVWRKDNRIFVPKCFVNNILGSYHGKGIHFGMSKTNQLVSYLFYWPKMNESIEEFINACDICKISKSNQPKPAPVQSLPLVSRPVERIALDYCGPFQESDQGNKYLLVIIDHFTRFVRVFPVPAATSSISAKCLEEFIREEGTPSDVLTDRGTHFIGEAFQQMLKRKGIHHLKTSPYHPQCDGMAERQMRTIKNLLRADLLEKMDFSTKSWDANIYRIVQVMNQSIHPATGHSPFSLARGRTGPDIKFPWMNVPSVVKQTLVPWRDISEKNKVMSERRNEKINKERELRTFEPGEMVWKRNQAATSLKPRYMGPFQIIKKIGDVNYEIEGEHIRQIMHVDHLIPARVSTRVRMMPRRRGRPGRRE